MAHTHNTVHKMYTYVDHSRFVISMMSVFEYVTVWSRELYARAVECIWWRHTMCISLTIAMYGIKGGMGNKEMGNVETRK